MMKQSQKFLVAFYFAMKFIALLTIYSIITLAVPLTTNNLSASNNSAAHNGTQIAGTQKNGTSTGNTTIDNQKQEIGISFTNDVVQSAYQTATTNKMKLKSFE